MYAFNPRDSQMIATRIMGPLVVGLVMSVVGGGLGLAVPTLRASPQGPYVVGQTVRFTCATTSPGTMLICVCK